MSKGLKKFKYGLSLSSMWRQNINETSMKKNLKHEVGQIDQTTINLVSLSITILQE